MNRLIMYTATLLIPAVPYVFMIYYPEKIDPVYRFLASENGVYAWIVLLNLVFLFSYFTFASEILQSGIHPNWIQYIKMYFIIFGVLATILLILIGASAVKPVLFSSVCGMFLFFIWQNRAKKT